MGENVSRFICRRMGGASVVRRRVREDAAKASALAGGQCRSRKARTRGRIACAADEGMSLLKADVRRRSAQVSIGYFAAERVLRKQGTLGKEAGQDVSTLFRRWGLGLLRLSDRGGTYFLKYGAAPNALAGLQEFRPDVVEQRFDLGNVGTHDAGGFELAGQGMNAHRPDHR